MATRDKIIALAKIGKPRGVKGDLRLYPLTATPQSLFEYHKWFIEFPKKSWQKAPAFSIHKLGQKFIIHFEGIDSPEIARQYVNAVIGTPISCLPALEEGEFYWAELMGLEVVNTNDESFGKVSDILETGANDVLVVKGKTERLIPYVDHVILKVDLKARKITVDWDKDN